MEIIIAIKVLEILMNDQYGSWKFKPISEENYL